MWFCRLLVCLTALQLYPGGFASLKEEVFAEQFRPVGGSWVEYASWGSQGSTELAWSTVLPVQIRRRAGFWIPSG